MKNNFLSAIVIFTSIVLLSACSSIPIEQVNGRIAAWKGQHIDELIKYWGLPSKQRKVGEKHYAEWLNKSSEPGNTAVTIGTGSRSRHTGIGIGLTLLDLGGKDDECSRLVTYADDGIVVDITWQGTNDYCFELTPDLGKVKSNTANRQKVSS